MICKGFNKTKESKGNNSQEDRQNYFGAFFIKKSKRSSAANKTLKGRVFSQLDALKIGDGCACLARTNIYLRIKYNTQNLNYQIYHN